MRRRRSVVFALPAILGILAVFVLDGVVAGIAALAAMLAFIGACIHAFRGPGAESAARTGLGGWIGGWF
jgi:hypothetical protein